MRRTRRSRTVLVNEFPAKKEVMNLFLWSPETNDATSTFHKSLSHQVGVTRFELATSWSRTKRSKPS